MHRAGQRLQQRRPAKLDTLRYLEEVLLDDAARYDDVLGERPVQELKPLAHGLVPDLAVVAAVARRAVRRHDAHPGAPALDALTESFNLPGELVSEGRGHRLEQRWMPTPVALHIRAAGKRRTNPHQHLARTRLRYRHVLHPDIFRGVEHRGSQGRHPPLCVIFTLLRTLHEGIL